MIYLSMCRCAIQWQVLQHMKTQHNVEIECIEAISDLHKYLEKWREKLKSSTIDALCPPSATGSRIEI